MRSKLRAVEPTDRDAGIALKQSQREPRQWSAHGLFAGCSSRLKGGLRRSLTQNERLWAHFRRAGPTHPKGNRTAARPSASSPGGPNHVTR